MVNNQSAIHLIKNPVLHKRTKHIQIHYHFIREKVQSKEIEVLYVPTELQLADICTKPLPRDRFKKLCDLIRIIDMCSKYLSGGSVGTIVFKFYVFETRYTLN